MEVFIITGEREGGKTSFLKTLYNHLANSEKLICGFISTGKIAEDTNKEFFLHNLVTKETLHLASRKKYPDYNFFGRFFFNPEAISFGESIIEKALDEKCDILIMDEIGPVEMTGNVWHDSLKSIVSRHEGILIISVRNRFINRIITHFRMKNITVFQIGKVNPETASSYIISCFTE